MDVCPFIAFCVTELETVYFGDFCSYMFCQYSQIKIPPQYKCFTVTVNSEIFAGILFSLIALKDIVA